MPSTRRKTHILRAYHENGLATDVEQASPHQLILLLFNGAITRIQQAQVQMRHGEIAHKGASISKAISIIEGLDNSLNPQQDPELARQLHQIYQYSNRRLLYANQENSIPALKEVEELIQTLREGWRAIETSALPPPEMIRETTPTTSELHRGADLPA